MCAAKTIAPIRGMHDVLPEQIGRWQQLEDTARSLFERYGYQELRIPLLERTELFKRTIGEVTDIVEKEMYTFEDRSGDSVTLRPEATAGIVRACISNSLIHNQAQRLYVLGPMFRHERPQRGRYRQFHQIDVEAFGFAGPEIDAELLHLSYRLWKELGIEGVELQLNSLGVPESRLRYREALVSYLSDHRSRLDADSLRRLETNPLRVLDSKNPEIAELIAEAPVLLDYLDPESAAHFATLQGYLEDSGIAFTVNPRLVRGLDYYTRTVFEWVTDRLGAQSAVCSGGRYDGLVKHLGGRETPGIGWALGVERIVELMDQTSAISPVDAYFVNVGPAANRLAARWSEELRDALPNLRLAVDCQGGSFKSQIKRADRSGATWALVMGEAEAASAVAGLKPLRTSGDQETVGLPDLIQRLASRLG